MPEEEKKPDDKMPWLPPAAHPPIASWPPPTAQMPSWPPGWFGETPRIPTYIPDQEPPTVEAYVPQVQHDEGEEEPEDAEEYDDMPTGYLSLY